MKRGILILVSALTLLIFSGCGEKVKYIYVKTQCPKLQTYEVNISKNKHFKLHYKVKETDENNRTSGR